MLKNFYLIKVFGKKQFDIGSQENEFSVQSKNNKNLS